MLQAYSLSSGSAGKPTQLYSNWIIAPQRSFMFKCPDLITPYITKGTLQMTLRIKIKNLDMGRSPGFSIWVQHSHKPPYEGGKRVSESEDVMWRHKQSVKKMWQLDAAGFEGRIKSHKPRSHLPFRSCQVKETNPPLQPCWHLCISLTRLILNLRHLNCKLIDLCCFKSLSLLYSPSPCLYYLCIHFPKVNSIIVKHEFWSYSELSISCSTVNY